ncbi:MAG: hypothetical protein PHS77_02410 [Gallionellaceae bacterium]|nr:hypothetical protein [Gallionellaceae bacterium]
MPMRSAPIHPFALLLACLAGCGVETAGTAAVAGKAAQEEAEAGRQLQQDLQDRLEAAAAQAQQRQEEAAAAAEQGGPAGHPD